MQRTFVYIIIVAVGLCGGLWYENLSCAAAACVETRGKQDNRWSPIQRLCTNISDSVTRVNAHVQNGATIDVVTCVGVDGRLRAVTREQDPCEWMRCDGDKSEPVCEQEYRDERMWNVIGGDEYEVIAVATKCMCQVHPRAYVPARFDAMHMIRGINWSHPHVCTHFHDVLPCERPTAVYKEIVEETIRMATRYKHLRHLVKRVEKSLKLFDYVDYLDALFDSKRALIVPCVLAWIYQS
jgi:hypothetical protein